MKSDERQLTKAKPLIIPDKITIEEQKLLRSLRTYFPNATDRACRLYARTISDAILSFRRRNKWRKVGIKRSGDVVVSRDLGSRSAPIDALRRLDNCKFSGDKLWLRAWLSMPPEAELLLRQAAHQMGIEDIYSQNIFVELPDYSWSKVIAKTNTEISGQQKKVAPGDPWGRSIPDPKYVGLFLDSAIALASRSGRHSSAELNDLRIALGQAYVAMSGKAITASWGRRYRQGAGKIRSNRQNDFLRFVRDIEKATSLSTGLTTSGAALEKLRLELKILLQNKNTRINGALRTLSF